MIKIKCLHVLFFLLEVIRKKIVVFLCFMFMYKLWSDSIDCLIYYIRERFIILLLRKFNPVSKCLTFNISYLQIYSKFSHVKK